MRPAGVRPRGPDVTEDTGSSRIGVHPAGFSAAVTAAEGGCVQPPTQECESGCPRDNDRDSDDDHRLPGPERTQPDSGPAESRTPGTW
jgi:hypothetical protein